MNEEAFGLSDDVPRISFIDQFISAHIDHKYVGHSVILGDQDNIFSIATCNRLDCPEVKCQRRRDFLSPIRNSPGAHPASCTMGTGSFPGVRQPGHDIDHPLPYYTKVTKRVMLYLCYHSVPSWHVG